MTKLVGVSNNGRLERVVMTGRLLEKKTATIIVEILMLALLGQ